MVTLLYDYACFIGTLRSIFIDAFGPNNADADGVINYYRGKMTSANNTNLDSTDEGLPKLKDSLFTEVYPARIMSKSDVSQIKDIDNVTSFALLIWDGKNGRDSHATRVVKVIGDTGLTVLDTTKGIHGEILFHTWDELFERSVGFTYFWLAKGVIDSTSSHSEQRS